MSHREMIGARIIIKKLIEKGVKIEDIYNSNLKKTDFKEVEKHKKSFLFFKETYKEVEFTDAYSKQVCLRYDMEKLSGIFNTLNLKKASTERVEFFKAAKAAILNALDVYDMGKDTKSFDAATSRVLSLINEKIGFFSYSPYYESDSLMFEEEPENADLQQLKDYNSKIEASLPFESTKTEEKDLEK